MGYALKVRARYRNDATGRELRFPVVLTEGGVLISHVRYLASSPFIYKSASWRERSVFSVIQLVKFINANEGLFTKTTELLEGFSLALVTGTINQSTLEDPSGLFWEPRRLEDARTLLGHITSYTDWLSEQSNQEIMRANPFRKATSVEQRMSWCAYYHKQAGIFLNHLSDNSMARKQAERVRQIKTPQPEKYSVNLVKRFPEDRFNDLIDHGFIRADARSNTPDNFKFDYKSQAITLLLHYGGLRKCEALHLYLVDIEPASKGGVLVRVHHPVYGNSPSEKYKNRAEYLMKEFRLRPRVEYLKTERLHLGWKAPLLEDKRGFFEVHFFPPEKANEFALAWTKYLKYQRVDPPGGEWHPYAFTNNFGRPETLKNFQRLHTNAVIRIGMECRKYLGTTEHGHRHSYGYRLAAHGFSQVEIQKAMHQKSPDSCLVYIQPTDDDVRNMMRKTEWYGARTLCNN
ncbi:site-specific integrase [Pseudomonas sp. Choline-3u-10]|jgi:integrase|uniref:gamma-mobile-trio recombinase GmtY n=1 Tax=Pseudomonadaceae TaxID=135621 RepID=UPI0009E2758B|nr:MULTISPECIES: gamma-mobile-trio recombinase GmtY [Pseudomonadaceae]MAL35684.1 site-specific integrase [Pseudomonas sp.]MBU0948212.1 site-specific integrase [Gammaproteobacteria bacterium]MBK3795266.1 tyrosine-type recombinase/integrase [Stutzerimonas stutzeri]MBK3878381.1 tyrosine-type recombinase/integrase [Stutzerimonas stutzeri]PKG96230.1 site-specific integrase [Pseudomonas sp. Choline-3u-10]|tara:strand:- start:4747 stop:6126 length:1380 start_codon:yes stop_codon:yes gene_type:complete